MPEFSNTFFSLKRLSLLTSSLCLLLILTRSQMADDDSGASLSLFGTDFGRDSIQLFIWCLFFAAIYYVVSFGITAYIERTKVLNAIVSNFSKTIEELVREVRMIANGLQSGRSVNKNTVDEIFTRIDQHSNTLNATLSAAQSKSTKLQNFDNEQELRARFIGAIAVTIRKGIELQERGTSPRDFPKAEAEKIFQEHESSLAQEITKLRTASEEASSKAFLETIKTGINQFDEVKGQIDWAQRDVSALLQRFEDALGQSAVKRLTNALEAELDAIKFRFWVLDVSAPLIVFALTCLHFLGLFQRLLPSLVELLPSF